MERQHEKKSGPRAGLRRQPGGQRASSKGSPRLRLMCLQRPVGRSQLQVQGVWARESERRWAQVAGLRWQGWAQKARGACSPAALSPALSTGRTGECAGDERPRCHGGAPSQSSTTAGGLTEQEPAAVPTGTMDTQGWNDSRQSVLQEASGEVPDPTSTSPTQPTGPGALPLWTSSDGPCGKSTRPGAPPLPQKVAVFTWH